MPPRIPIQAIDASAILHPSSGASVCLSQASRQQATAAFSTSVARPRFSQRRRDFRKWEAERGSAYKIHRTPGTPNYLASNLVFDEEGNKKFPFPINKHFVSHPVLDDAARELVWEKIMRRGETIKSVSAEYGIDIRRVAAIVRLKEVEKDWISRGERLAKPYAKAVLSMVPTWRISTDQQNDPYERINEIHVHPLAMQQIFWPTSESKHFTREDAAKAFHPTLLSADKRIPHPELVQMEREVAEGRALWDASERFKQAAMESERKAAEKQQAKVAAEEKKINRVNTDRFEFRFRDFNAEAVGHKGRSRNAVGWRYGTPYPDRAKDHQIKIPTQAPAP
ncbi:eukaryotic mitochondrial regulator protein-domain-containing protein [Xylariaceae sp. FL1272]|nr:eukaryotic mitochondrial regulator protein-domain-containing protein [Xylariaceae sp. FL1272]